MHIEHTISTPTGDIKLSTGKVAKLSAGAVMVQKGNTVILATADISKSATDADFFPLTVEYLERYSAVGTLSGSRFNKRESFPNDDAILAARQIDHTIRPLFPKNLRKPTNVIITLLSDDGENNPEELIVIGTSAALMISGIPFAGPVASIIATVDLEGNVEINPTEHLSDDELLGHFVLSGTADKVLNIEGWGKQLTDEKMDEIMDAGMAQIANLCKGQEGFYSQVKVEMIEVEDNGPAAELVKIFTETERKDLETAMYIADKMERDEKVAEFRNAAFEKYETEEVTKSDLFEAFDYAMKKILRENVIKNEKRLSGRKTDEVRELSAEIDVLPNNVHGSALFSRGYTQSLSQVTLGSTRKSVGFDDMTGEDTVVPFMHHYNFPPFSVGEAGRVRYRPGRREIGHGMIGENALRHMIPNQEDFPYTVRAVSEIMTSNGSTSMAATCGSSLALMAAGVPMKAAVAGIGVGLVTEDETQANYKLLLDIEGVEDFFGDMDFKVTGTRDGMTAIQFETKLQGVKPEILKEAFRLANTGRQQVLDVMEGAIMASRDSLSPMAPRVESIRVPQDKIGEIIGPGGKVIKEIVAEAAEIAAGEPEIDIQDDGTVNITAVNQDQIEFVANMINLIAEGPVVGNTYEAEVVTEKEFGVFVDIGFGVQGLVHISEITDEKRINAEDISKYVKVGEMVKVKLLDKSPGRLSFSIKAAK